MKFEEQTKIPVLLFLLEHNKFSQIIKAMLNQTVSNNMLQQYGTTIFNISKQEQFKINQAASRFTIKQSISLKGSNQNVIKQYQNESLMQIIRKKIHSQKMVKEVRKILWVQFTEMWQKKHFYNNLKQLELATDFQTNIEKDIKRTYKSPQVIAKTEQVLGVFAQYNPYIGYCQGMNTIIAFLIDEGFSCEQAFFIFKRVTEQLLPCDYYNSMDCIMAYMRIFYQILSFTHPECYARLKLISKQMENSFVAMISFVLQWFVCLFCNDNIHGQVTRVIWDFFLIQGIVTLFKAGLAFFDFLSPHILCCHSFQAYNEMQKTYIQTIKDANHIRNKIINTYISPQLLFLLKQKLVQQDEQNNKNEGKKTVSKTSNKKCNKKWNACLQVLDNNMQNHYIYDYFVFKTADNINIEDDYLLKLHKQYFSKQKGGSLTDTLIIGRIPHVCQTQEDLITEDSISEKNELGLPLRKKIAKSLQDPKSPLRIAQQNIRKKAVQKIEQVINKKEGIERSQSIIFMQDMVKNISFSNLMQLYQIDEMFQ